MLFWLFFALLFLDVHGGFTNYTIDDTNGDVRTGAIPIYEPGNDTIPYGEGWTGNCEDCWVIPNSEEVFDGTWHHATDLHSGYTGLTISFSFTGTALYVYCIIPTYWGGANWFGTSNGSSTWTNMTFALDGKPSGSYVYTPPMDNTDASSMEYNALVFVANGLQNSEHQFVAEPVNGSIIMFDYAIYTLEDETPGTTTIHSSIKATSTSSGSLPSSNGTASVPATTTASTPEITSTITTSESSTSVTIISFTTSTSTSTLTSTIPGITTGISIFPTSTTGYSSITTIIVPTSGTSTPSPHILPKSQTSWRMLVVVSVSGAAVFLGLLLLIIFLCKRRNRRLERISGESPNGLQRGLDRIQDNPPQIREDVIQIVRDRDSWAISSRASLLSQHRTSFDPAPRSEMRSSDAHLSQTYPLQPRQNTTSMVPILGRVSSASSYSELIESPDDVRSMRKRLHELSVEMAHFSFQKSQASPKLDNGNEEQEDVDRITIASSNILPPSTYTPTTAHSRNTSMFRISKVEEAPPLPSHRRPRSLPLPGIAQTPKEQYLFVRP